MYFDCVWSDLPDVILRLLGAHEVYTTGFEPSFQESPDSSSLGCNMKDAWRIKYCVSIFEPRYLVQTSLIRAFRVKPFFLDAGEVCEKRHCNRSCTVNGRGQHMPQLN